MKQTINGVDYYERESDAKEAYAVRPAKGMNRPVLLLCHGIGERSAGAVANLLNVVDGWDYDNNPDTPRQYPFETDIFEAFAAKYDFHLVTVTYPQSFEPNDYVYVLGQVLANYSVDKTRLYAAGFSLGGGAILKLGTSSIQNASMMAGLIAAAPVNWATNHKNVADARLQMVVTTCEQDDTVSPSNAKDFVAKVNALNPEFPAFLIIYPGRAHSGFNEILGEENTWKWMASNSTDKRIPFTRSSGTLPTTPTKPTDPVTTATAAFNITEGDVVTTADFVLDGSSSKGANSFYWSVQKAESPWNGPVFEKGTVGGPTKKISGLTDGKWQAQLTVNDTIKTKLINFTVKIGNNPASKTLASVAPAPVDITWSDKTTEKGTVEFKDSKWILKDLTGKII